MNRIVIYISLVILLFSLFLNGQSRKDWNVLDYLNNDLDEHPFETEQDISGLFFVTLSDNFNYYEEPIQVDDEFGNQILEVKVKELVVIEYKKEIYKNYNEEKFPFNPWLLSLNPDYFRLAFECVEETEDCFIIKLNDSDLGYVKKDNPDFKKESNEEFIKGWMSLGLDFDRSKNPLLQDLNSKKEIPNPHNGKYKIWQADFIEMKGDWIKIKTFENEIGWVRWRKKNKILVRVYYAC